MTFDTIFNQACIPHSPPTREGNSCDDASSNCTPSRTVSSSPLDDDEAHHQHHHHNAVPPPPPPHLVAACSTSDDSITGRYCNIEHKYHIDPHHVLGTGHHGSVRECIERDTGHRYAVKTIYKADPMVKPGGLAREIMLLQEMNHASIVQLVDVYEDAEYVHLVTELCHGGELFDKIVDKSNCDNGSPCFREEKAAEIMHQLLEGISYMHKRGIVHRDIKPENILFETTHEDSSVKIIDFGLSRKHYGSRCGESPMSTVVGTPYYIAPEVLKRRYDKACDLWSVGVIAYILLCGYPPFNGTDIDKTHKSVLRGKYFFPAEDWNGISQEAMDFIYRLLQVDPRRRMDVEEALNHPWMVNRGDADSDKRSCVKSDSQVASTVGPAPAVPTPVVLVPPPPPLVEERQDNSSVEVLHSVHNHYNQLPTRHIRYQTATTRKQHPPCNSPPRRKVKLSMFAL